MTEFDAFRDNYADEINAKIRFSGQDLDFFTKAKAELLHAAIARHLDAAQPALLDVGCGHGLIHPFLCGREDSVRLTGIDIADSVVELARAQNPRVRYDVYDGARFPYPDDSFDLAFTICVLHHVAPNDRPTVLSEMRRVVRPGGLIAVIEHNPLNPLTQYIVRTCPLDENAVLLWPGEVHRRFAAAGIATLDRRYFLFTPFDKPPFRRLDGALGWLPLGAQYLSLARVGASGSRWMAVADARTTFSSSASGAA